MPTSRRPAPESPTGPIHADAELVPSPATIVAIVVGSTIAAEVRDRPLAYRLRERIAEWLAANEPTNHTSGPKGALKPVVCSDVWYLNARDLAEQPVIAVGEPNTNAATALIANRLPTAFVVEGVMRLHLDPEYLDLRAALWGANAAATASAIDVFAERYLHHFLGAAA